MGLSAGASAAAGAEAGAEVDDKAGAEVGAEAGTEADAEAESDSAAGATAGDAAKAGCPVKGEAETGRVGVAEGMIAGGVAKGLLGVIGGEAEEAGDNSSRGVSGEDSGTA